MGRFGDRGGALAGSSGSDATRTVGDGVLRLAPNLPDEADNHLIELALAGNAEAIVTHNVRDVGCGELRLGPLRILTPAQCLEEWR